MLRPKATAIKMTEGPFMFKSFLGSWKFKFIDENTTKVTFLYSFKLGLPFSVLSSLITKNLESNDQQRLFDLKSKQ